MLEPTYYILLIKVIYFSLIFLLVGWAIYPQIQFPNSKIANWIFYQGLGFSFLLLFGFNLVNYDIPAKWIALLPPILVIYRLIKVRASFKKQIIAQNIYLIKKSFFLFLVFSFIISLVYLFPFFLLKTSGLYAYGGGDHSTYFRISELVTHKSLKDLVVSWELKWPPTESYTSMTVPLSGYPPVPNWSINNFLFYIKYARQSMTFANQTIAVPFFALGFGDEEESYTAGVTVCLLLLCWSTAIFISTIAKKENDSVLSGVAACTIALGAPALSLILKQTIPAVYAWGTMLLFCSTLIIKNRQNDINLRASFPVGIAFAGTYLMYLPAIFVTGLVWLYELFYKIRSNWKQKIAYGAGIILVFIAATNREIDRPIKLFFSNALGAILDYRLNLKIMPFTLIGVLDFESALNQKISWPLTISASVIVCIGLFLFKKLKNKESKLLACALLPILAAVCYYYIKGGDYHVIRLTEFFGTLILAISSIGLSLCWRPLTRYQKIILSFLLCAFLANSFYLKQKYYRKIFSADPDARAGIIRSNDIQLTKILASYFKDKGYFPVVYWLGWGAVPFANHEILFRNLQYVEGFEYDYSYVKMNLLDKKYLNRAVLVYPNDKEDILEIDKKVLPNQRNIVCNNYLQEIGVKSGAALLGTGWLPPTKEKDKIVRYLRSNHEGGLIIWSEANKKLNLNIDASGVEPELQLTVEHTEFILPQKGKIYKQDNESNKQFFARIEKNSSQDKSIKDLIYAVSVELEKSMQPPQNLQEFNTMLQTSDNFRSLILQCLEKKSSFTKDLESQFAACHQTVTLNSFHQDNPTRLQIKLEMQPGFRIIKFIVRNQSGQRDGRHSSSGIFYNPNLNIPWVVVHKVSIF